jgi:hypothetical protein
MKVSRSITRSMSALDGWDSRQRTTAVRAERIMSSAALAQSQSQSTQSGQSFSRRSWCRSHLHGPLHFRKQLVRFLEIVLHAFSAAF